MSIQRYSLDSESDLYLTRDGDYVLFADHEREMDALRTDILDSMQKLLDEANAKVAELEDGKSLDFLQTLHEFHYDTGYDEGEEPTLSVVKGNINDRYYLPIGKGPLREAIKNARKEQQK